MPLAAIALGSNLGDRERNLHAAVDDLSSLGPIIAVSRFLQTTPVGYLDQPDFLNGAALLQTEHGPVELLRAMLAIECAHGRDRSHGIAKGPRTLDLDLLLYGEDILQTAALVLPHPEFHLRRFVLEPLAEIAPGWVHPVLQRTVADLLHSLPHPA